MQSSPSAPVGLPATISNRPQSTDSSRPPKRARKETVPSDLQESTPIDHVFITEGHVKKQPAKKPPLSCAECRRLKLKCDRVFPCKSCSKRGCADICPQGVLVSGRGTRFVLANTEQLHAKISQMSDRIRHLEDALQVLQPSSSLNPHPLLTAELLEIKSALALYGETQTGTSHSRTTPSEDPQEHDEPPLVDPNYRDSPSSDRSDESPNNTDKNPIHLEQVLPEIMRRSHNFPLVGAVAPDTNTSMRSHIRGELPPRSQASYLWEQVRQNALWQHNPHPNETFIPNLLYHVYESSPEDLCPRRLALLFMILAIGSLVDLNQPSDSLVAEKYHHLARASLCEVPLMEDTTVDVIVTLFYMTWYLLAFSDERKATSHSWGLLGLAAKLAQSIGLHREGIKSKVIPEEVERRRALFWELLYLDARLSLSLGRPPSFVLSHVDSQRPTYVPDEGCRNSEGSHYYQEWKHSCFIHCLNPMLEITSSPTLDYATVIELDKTIRNFHIPSILQSSERTLSRPLTMQRASSLTALEAMLLQLHRTYFIQALSRPEEALNCQHKYAPSVVAIFLSASRMIATVEWVYSREPDLSVRILWYWSNAFSAAVALCLLVSRAPFTSVSLAVLQELERARLLFTSAKDRCPRVLQVIPTLENMIDKANHTYAKWSKKEEIPLMLRRNIDEASASGHVDTPRPRDANEYSKVFMSEQRPRGPFASAHPNLEQCIAEAHQIALVLLRLRTESQNSAEAKLASVACPQIENSSSSVLPQLFTGRFAYGVMQASEEASSDPTARVTIIPASRMAIVDTLNFDFGALNPNWNDQSWMAWF